MTVPRSLFIAAILGAAVCAGAAHAASGHDPPRPDKADKPIVRDKPAEKKADRPASDLVTCRRDATNLHGPERARFMTQCIRKR